MYKNFTFEKWTCDIFINLDEKCNSMKKSFTKLKKKNCHRRMTHSYLGCYAFLASHDFLTVKYCLFVSILVWYLTFSAAFNTKTSRVRLFSNALLSLNHFSFSETKNCIKMWRKEKKKKKFFNSFYNVELLYFFFCSFCFFRSI